MATRRVAMSGRGNGSGSGRSGNGPPTRPLNGAHQCPGCRSGSVRRSGRKGLYENLLLRLARYRPYLCLACGRRFYDRPLKRGE